MKTRGKVVVTTNPVVATDSPSLMRYGGVERVAFVYAETLKECGFEVISIAPNDSWFPDPIDERNVWPCESLASPTRSLPAYVDDVEDATGDYARFVAEAVDREDPDAILMLGPSGILLATLETLRPDLLDHTIVSLRNGPQDNNDEVLQMLEMHEGIVVTALTKIHQQSFAAACVERGFPRLAARIQLVQDGVLIGSNPFADNPATVRNSDAWKNAGWNLDALANRRVISQVDYFSPNKGQLLTVEAFARANLVAQGFDLVLAGGFGWQLPSRTSADHGANEAAQQYMRSINEAITRYELDEHVHILGALPGAGVEMLNHGSDIVAHPVRMDHGDLWPGTANQDPEAHGLSIGHAMSAGTPVLCSTKVDASRRREGVTGYAFSTLPEFVTAMQTMARDCVNGRVDRAAIREFAIQHDSVVGAITEYAQICHSLAGDHDAAPDAELVAQAVARVAAGEASRASGLLAEGNWAEPAARPLVPVVDLRDDAYSGLTIPTPNPMVLDVRQRPSSKVPGASGEAAIP